MVVQPRMQWIWDTFHSKVPMGNLSTQLQVSHVLVFSLYSIVIGVPDPFQAVICTDSCRFCLGLVYGAPHLIYIRNLQPGCNHILAIWFRQAIVV